MNIKDFDFNLPEELIAQHPKKHRDECKLMVVDRKNDLVEHKFFYDVLDYLKEGDVLVLNDSKVLPARLFGYKKHTGAKIEFLLTKRVEGDTWQTLVKPGKKAKIGDVFVFNKENEPKFEAVVKGYDEGGTRIVEFVYDGIFLNRLEELGSMPLPPYIQRASNVEDKDDYQTVYCKEEGSVAAPTAGLHFTNELLKKLKAKGVKLAYVTLHVGIGTFRPVKCENILDHNMHFEEYHISEEARNIINDAIKNKNRIICVGTTSVRSVESSAVKVDGEYFVQSGSSSTDIFIYPGYEFKIVKGLITNFHLPKSTLLMLISALYDREKILKAYDEAIKNEYRFFSYGDAMFII